MKAPRATLLPIFLLAVLTPCFAHHIAVVVNQENKVSKLTSIQLAKIIRSETRTWQGGQPIVIVLQEDAPGELSTLARLLKLSPEDCKALIAAHKNSIRLATSDEDVLQTVKANPGAIGFVEVHAIDGSVNLLTIDGKLPMEAGYLSH